MSQKFVQNVSGIVLSIRYKLQQTQFLRYTYLVFLAGFFISPDNHLHRNFYYIFVIVPFLIGSDLNLIHNCIRSTLIKLSMVFLLYFWASMFWTAASLSSEEYYDLSRYFLMLVIFLMASVMLSSTSEEWIDEIKFWIASVAFIAAITFTFIFYATNSFPSTRLSGYFDYTRNPNQASMYFGFIGILAFHSALCSKKAWHQLFNWFVSLTLLGYIFFSQSRGPLLAFILAMTIGSIFGKNWKTIGIFIILITGLFVFVEFFDSGIESFYERGFAFRLLLWKKALKNISEALLFGKGWFADVSVYNPLEKLMRSPHNLLLLVSAKSGVIGGGLLLLLIITAILHSYNYFRASGNWLFICIFVYFIVCMTFDSTHLLYKPNLGWLIFWMPIALLAGEEIRLKNFAPGLSR